MISFTFVCWLAPKLKWSIGRISCLYNPTRVDLYSHQILSNWSCVVLVGCIPQFCVAGDSLVYSCVFELHIYLDWTIPWTWYFKRTTLNIGKYKTNIKCKCIELCIYNLYNKQEHERKTNVGSIECNFIIHRVPLQKLTKRDFFF